MKRQEIFITQNTKINNEINFLCCASTKGTSEKCPKRISYISLRDEVIETRKYIIENGKLMHFKDLNFI